LNICSQLRLRLDRWGSTGILAQSTPWSGYAYAWKTKFPSRKNAFGKGEYSLGPLPIHANRRGNPTTPSEAGKRSLSHDGSQHGRLSHHERWRQLSPGDGSLLTMCNTSYPPLPSFPPLLPLALGFIYRKDTAESQGQPGSFD
jgi:hypothetical protein